MYHIDEFRDRYANRYFGKYRAIVTDPLSDSLKIGRIKVKCPVVLGDEELAWALPSPPTGGGFNTGELVLPRKGDYVWVEFEEGDPERAIWMHGPWGNRGGVSMVPRHSQEKGDATDFARRNYGNIPPSQFEGQYGYVRYLGVMDGSFLELDATPGVGRVQLSHYTGTRIEMQSDGGMQEVVTQTARRHVGANHDVEVIGKEKYFVGNDRSLQINGDYYETIKGKVNRTFKEKTEAGESSTQSLEGNSTNTIKGNWTQKVMGQGLINVGGQMGFMCAQNIQFTASENLEIIGMNANGQISIPTMDKAVLVHGYNGNAVVQASDPTGLVVVPKVTLRGLLTDPFYGGATLEAGDFSGTIPTVGRIDVLPLAAANVHLGGAVASDPVILGTKYQTMMTPVITGFYALINAMAGDVLLKAIAPATSAAAIAFLPIVNTWLSTFNSTAHLSKMVMSK